MADPITPDYWRAIWAWQGKSGLPDDQYVNTFVFRNDFVASDAQDVHDAIKNALQDFYTAPGTGGSAIQSWLAGDLINGAVLKTYDLGQAPPRDPVTSTMLAAEFSMDNSDALPPEVAVCVTWHTAVNRPWGRGRNYLGPFTKGAIGASTPTGDVPVASTLVTAIADAAQRLQQANPMVLSVLGSRGPNVVTGGYVDNAPDTQRRRGSEATLRTSFGAVNP